MGKTLKVGDKAPAFALPDQDGNSVDVGSLIGKKALVIYFYPKDFTTGCTMEAHEFRDMHEQFLANGAEVIGISADDVKTHKEFAVEHELPFKLLADTENKVRDMYGAWGLAHTPGRVTFLVDKQGVIRMVFSSQMQPKKHIEEGLRILKEINK
ncbi:MAG: peroxiredoxin [Methanomassiliicoccales archaeon]|nr:peroxiredoxin [Methanomassiliicoccales archaeon]MDD1756222.1 peroxiredoxin [Methanomassiliicoccales archaeon]